MPTDQILDAFLCTRWLIECVASIQESVCKFAGAGIYIYSIGSSLKGHLFQATIPSLSNLCIFNAVFKTPMLDDIVFPLLVFSSSSNRCKIGG